MVLLFDVSTHRDPDTGCHRASDGGIPVGMYPGTRVPGTAQRTHVLPTVPDLITNAEILARKAQYKMRARIS
eukprot:2997963-Rhodomonas_salina.1